MSLQRKGDYFRPFESVVLGFGLLHGFASLKGQSFTFVSIYCFVYCRVNGKTHPDIKPNNLMKFSRFQSVLLCFSQFCAAAKVHAAERTVVDLSFDGQVRLPRRKENNLPGVPAGKRE